MNYLLGQDPSAEGIYLDPTPAPQANIATATGTISAVSGSGLRITPASNSIAANQNSGTPLAFAVASDRLERYEVAAVAPEGWAVSIAASQLTVTPSPESQNGTAEIRLVVRSQDDPTRVSSTTVTVTIQPTLPGLAVNVAFDPLLTVPYAGAELPTAYRASARNLGLRLTRSP